MAGWWNEGKHVIGNNTMVWLGGEAQIIPLQSQHFMQLVVEDAGSRLKGVIVRQYSDCLFRQKKQWFPRFKTPEQYILIPDTEIEVSHTVLATKRRSW